MLYYHYESVIDANSIKLKLYSAATGEYGKYISKKIDGDINSIPKSDLKKALRPFIFGHRRSGLDPAFGGEYSYFFNYFAHKEGARSTISTPDYKIYIKSCKGSTRDELCVEVVSVIDRDTGKVILRDAGPLFTIKLDDLKLIGKKELRTRWA